LSERGALGTRRANRGHDFSTRAMT
jgi:hypothetical protein